MRDEIKKAVDAYQAAKASLKETMAREQQQCAHARVIQSPWRSSEWGPAHKARRLCLDCGREEEAMHSGWGDHDSDYTALKTGGFHKAVDAQELYRARLPHAPVNANGKDERGR